MAITLSNIKYILQRELQDSNIDDETVLIWCNNAQSDFAVNLNIPATGTISVITTDLSYPLPTDLKIINRLYFQSDYDNGIDKEYSGPYRIYNGQIIFPTYFMQADTLNVDYYKQMTYFTDIDDVIDINDRYSTIYTFYGKMSYYGSPSAVEKFGQQLANRRLQDSTNAYFNIRKQVIQHYLVQNEPVTVDERW